MAVELLIFDCDGVLVDSEPLAARVLAEALLELGLPMSNDEVDHRFRGRSLSDIVVEIEALLGTPVPEYFLPKLNTKTRHAFEVELTPIQGVRSALAEFRDRGLPMCVASSGSPEKIRHSLALTDLEGFFEDRVFSASQVKRGKPAPDLFLFAAQQMGPSIASCLVIEDSIPGVVAAVAAGASVYGFASRTLPDPSAHGLALLEQGAQVFGSMEELPGLLRLAGVI